MIEAQFEELRADRREVGGGDPVLTRLSNGGALIAVPDIDVEGWSRSAVSVLFVAPPGFPAAQPDCFWVEPGSLRLANGATPHASNDSNAIPGDDKAGRDTTWFSWHLQRWDPNRDTLKTYLKVIMTRLVPAR